MKYSLISKKTLSEVDLHEFKYLFRDFSEKLFVAKPNEQLSKSKSIDYIKYMQQGVSPVYQIPQSPLSISEKPKEVKPFHFPVSKLESYGHEVH